MSYFPPTTKPFPPSPDPEPELPAWKQWKVYRVKHLMAKYGMSKELASFLTVATVECEICGRKLKESMIHIDHKHNGQPNFRGILCSDCNQGIGRLKESTEVMKAAISYLNAS